MTHDSPFPFVASGSYPTRGGNLVRPLIDGEPAFRRICNAIETARRSVWVTITFMWPSFVMPDGKGTALDVLDRAARRGVDVRVVFWRPDAQTARHKRNAFWGAPEHIELLKRNDYRIRIRWDRAQAGFCQHQKSWLIDASEETETSFIGGINLNPHSMAMPGHQGEGQNHDVYVELAGPAVADVHRNFVERWNDASERHADDGRWGRGSDIDLPPPHRTPQKRGNAIVQIQRTMPHGEQTNLYQYIAAIRAARRTIYMENQYVEVAEIVAALHEALRRGVEVALLMPAVPDISPTAYATPERRAFFAARAALGAYETFTLAGIAGLGADGGRTPVYVHSKLMLVDDIWATVGSCNLHRFSLFGNCELNAAFSDPETVQAFRVALLQEHLGHDTSALDDLAALRLFHQIARANRRRHEDGDARWQGLAVSLDTATYGQSAQL